MKKFIFFLIVLLLACFASFARQASCDKCLLQKVTLFDATVKIQKPDSNEYSWEYEQLSWPTKVANSYIFNNDPSHACWFFIDKAFIAGEASTGNQPAPAGDMASGGKFISEELSFLVTSTVTGTGENSKMVMEIQSACDRKTIARSEVSFSWKDNPDALQKVGEQAAQQLMPMNEKIMEYARQLRETDTRYMLNGTGGEIKIKPKKTKLGVGEETEVEIQVMDCDGYLLKNRTVSFTKGTMNGLVINGTEGGIITPATVVTDEQGKAKVKFKLTRANGTAIIYAHFTGLNPAGCNDVVFGSAHIGGIPVQIGLSYMYHDTEDVIGNAELLNMIQTNLNLHTYAYKRHGMSLLYYPAQPLKGNFSIAIPAREDEPPVKVKYLQDEGVYLTVNSATGNLASLTAQGSGRRIRSGNSDPAQHTRIKLDWNESDVAELQIEFFYKPQGDEYLNDPVKDAYFFRSSKGASFVKNKITDKDTPYKWEYVITLDRVDGLTDSKAMGTVMNYSGITKEQIVLRLLTPYE